jgi:type III secretion apparatus needle protein
MTVSFASIPTPGYSIQDVATTFLSSIRSASTSLQESINNVTAGDPAGVLNIQLQMSQYTLLLSTVSQSISSLTTISKQITQAIGQA